MHAREQLDITTKTEERLHTHARAHTQKPISVVPERREREGERGERFLLANFSYLFIFIL